MIQNPIIINSKPQPHAERYNDNRANGLRNNSHADPLPERLFYFSRSFVPILYPIALTVNSTSFTPTELSFFLKLYICVSTTRSNASLSGAHIQQCLSGKSSLGARINTDKIENSVGVSSTAILICSVGQT
jgi:hypothetical protein